MGKISKIWQHFDKIDKSSAKCKICLKKYGSSGNTTNLHSHLVKIHNIDLSSKFQAQNKNIDDPDECFEKPTSVCTYTFMYYETSYN